MSAPLKAFTIAEKSTIKGRVPPYSRLYCRFSIASATIPHILTGVVASTSRAENELRNEVRHGHHPAYLRPLPPVRINARLVTNGKRLHVKAPGDTAFARRFRDILVQIISEMVVPMH